ncbi:DHA2 family efflux MFS transporter permease subunit [Aquirhabdus parva]|uniref:MFS transporter n=1 Tax=Aquirhabdus parva TaxID=2283318 RepID=A0A345P9U3_9GAMM|nr:DHA2 family efflux MFS transporter permease subunit [Aquirhabdus parva]AXI04052.1 MFS transporter [Aquirhabdus parva]
MSSAIAAARPPQYMTGLPLIILTIAIALATFMEVLDTAIANVAVPTIAGNMGVSSNQGTWVISSYGLAAAMAVPVTGWIAKRFGEVKVFVVSVFLFTIASALCGFAQSLPELVAFRFLQGLVSGPMVPLSQTLLLSNYPPEKRGTAMTIWVMTVVVAPICGPLLGGYITDNLTWPWIFYINLPVGLLAGFVVFTLLRKKDTPTEKLPIDVVGGILLVLGVGSLQLMLDNGNDLDWFSSNVIVGLCITAVVALTFFVAWELTDDHPLVDLRLLKKHNFRFGVIALSLGFMMFFALTVLFPLWLQTVMNYNPSWAGIATAPVGIFALICSPIVAKVLMPRLDLRLLSSVSFVIFGITAFWFSTFNTETSINEMIPPRLLQGVAVAFFFVPVNTIILSGIAQNQMAAASGLSNFFRTLSGSFGTALVVMILDHRSKGHQIQLAEHVNPTNQAMFDYTGQLQALGIPQGASYAQIQNVIVQQSTMMATSEIFWLCSIIFIALIGVIWLTKPPFLAGGAGGGH